MMNLNVRSSRSETPLKTGADTYSAAITGAQNYMRWVLNSFQPYLKGHIVEVGIGHGHYGNFLSDCGDYLGIDHDAQSIAAAKVTFPDRAFATCDFLDPSELRKAVPDGADAIVTINVLEHIEDDARAIANLVDVLRPGGHLLLSVPALMQLYNDLDRLAGHYRRYSKERLRIILQQQRVEIIRLCYFNPIGGIGWWANSFKHHKSLNDNIINNQIRFFDRHIVPISKALDPLFRSFFGQSVTCVARRRCSLS
jgi:SAM-dependent methyltransferase